MIRTPIFSAPTLAALTLALTSASALAQTDALARLRQEQEQVIREIEASESAEPQSQKGQHMNSGRSPRS